MASETRGGYSRRGPTDGADPRQPRQPREDAPQRRERTLSERLRDISGGLVHVGPVGNGAPDVFSSDAARKAHLGDLADQFAHEISVTSTEGDRVNSPPERPPFVRGDAHGRFAGS